MAKKNTLTPEITIEAGSPVMTPFGVGTLDNVDEDIIHVLFNRDNFSDEEWDEYFAWASEDQTATAEFNGDEVTPYDPKVEVEEDEAPAAKTKAKTKTPPTPKAPVRTDPPTLNSVWLTKRNGDRYAVVEHQGGENGSEATSVKLKWLDGSYSRTVKVSRFYGHYVETDEIYTPEVKEEAPADPDANAVAEGA